MFTVMIQFGSVLAVMWLYRAKILGAFLGLPSDPAARRFALMLVIASIPAGLAGRAARRLGQEPALSESRSHRGRLHRRRRRDPADRALPAQRRSCSRLTRRPSRGRSPSGVCQMLALVPGVSRSGATIVGGLLLRSRSSGGGGVLVLPRDADAGRRVSARFVGGARPSGARARRGDRHRVRHGVSRRAGGREAVSALRGALRFRPVCLVPHRGRAW